MTTAGLEDFLAMCSETEIFYAGNPTSKLNSWIYLIEDGRLGADTVQAPFPHAPHLGEAIYPICTFCSTFPTGLPFMADTLVQAYWGANRLRIKTQRRAA